MPASLLARSHFFLLAFLTQELKSPLGFSVGSRYFCLHLGGGLFEFRRETHVAVVLHARTRRDKAPDDHVLLESAQVADHAVDAGFGEHARRLLEARGGRRE